MVSQKAVINAKTGIHARPASDLVSFARKFKSTINMNVGNKSANCSSIISILALGARFGTEIIITAEGLDEEEAAKAVANYVQSIED